MQILNNINSLSKNNLKDVLKPSAKLKVAASCFSIYAFERKNPPIDAPEMKTAKNLILQKIQEEDSDQYLALLPIIDVANPAKDLQTTVETQ